MGIYMLISPVGHNMNELGSLFNNFSEREQEELAITCRTGNIDVIRKYSSRVTNIAAKNQLFFIVCKHRNKDDINKFLSFFVRTINWNYAEALACACELNHTAAIQHLLYLCESKTNRICNLCTAMYRACSHGYIQLVQFLVEYNNQHGSHTNFVHAMKFACEYGSVEIIKYLETLGFDVAGCLSMACLSRDMATVQYVASKMLAILPVDMAELNFSLRIACGTGNIPIAKHMVQCGATNFAAGLEESSRCGKIGMFDYMIQCGATNYTNALQAACSNDNLNIVKKLLSLGVTLNMIAGLRTAFRQDNMYIVKYLVLHGAMHHCLERSTDFFLCDAYYKTHNQTRTMTKHWCQLLIEYPGFALLECQTYNIHKGKWSSFDGNLIGMVWEFLC